MNEKTNGPSYAESAARLLKHLEEQEATAPAETAKTPSISLWEAYEAARKGLAKFLGLEPEGDA